MSQTLLQQIWDKTLQNLTDKEGFESERINEIKDAVANDSTDQLESLLCKEYEDQKLSN